MNFMSYSNETQSNIIPKEEFENLVKETFNVVANALCKSLGPLGSSTTILDGMQTEATKDGYAIFKNLRFHNRYKKMIYNLIKAPCTRTNNTVGDGTSTSIALTNFMFNRYKSRENVLDTLYRLPRQFTNTWDYCINDIIERVKKKSTVIDSDDFESIYNLAYVSSNGNDEISRAIAETYQKAKSPAIKEKDSPTNKSYIEEVNGFEFPTNLISDAYVRNEDLTAEETNIHTMIFDHKIETDIFNKLIVPINDVIRSMGHKLLIIAPFYDAYMCDTVVNQYANMEYQRYKSLNMILSQYPLGKLEKNQLFDLSVILRSKTITQDLVKGLIAELESTNTDTLVEKILNNEEYAFNRLIGSAEYALLSCNNGSIFKVSGIENDKIYKETLTHAKKELEDAIANTDFERHSYESKIYNVRSRILQLEMKNYIYYIGADSALQKQIIWDSVEDVIKCVRSAIKYGVVPGCQLSIINACNEATNEMFKDKEPADLKNVSDEEKLKVEIFNLIKASVVDVYSSILHGPDNIGMIKLQPNWYNVTEDNVEDLKKSAIESAKSIVNKSIKINKVFDLETLDYSDKIITSMETDCMVLSAASELIKILISGNQCVFLDAEVNGSDQSTVEAYV